MIASIEGQVVDLNSESVIVKIGGIGLQIFIPSNLLNNIQIGSLVHLHTYLSVREDNLSLYGFNTAEEREFFILLIGVNGVGPKLALAGLSTLSPDAIRRAVLTEQSEIFVRIPGVGKRTAQKILLHLQGKVTATGGIESVAILGDIDTGVLEALVTLGYSVVEAQAALQTIPNDAPEEIEERLRIALSSFST